ncbi:MAG: hypothetical protein KF886_25580 [Candidatus Hydrogenedentes bacterium]|nr:hypothetical protein [Candidatus Hydrogenedentota bacterium]
MSFDPAQNPAEPEEPNQEGLFDAQLSLPLPFVGAPEPITTVVKRNGREEAFDRGKITNAIFRAAESIGGDDRGLADSLARAVTIYLTKQLGGHAPTVDHIHDAVERVLIQMDHIRTAFAYARYRDRRARIRRLREGDMRLLLGELEEARDRGEAVPPAGSGLFVRTSAETLSTWDRDRIVEALVRETGLDRGMAGVIAAEVEQQLDAAGIQHLSSALVRELVAARLVAHGLHEFRDRQQRLGAPLYDCERIIRGLTESTARRDPVATDYVLAGAVKKEYALARVYSAAVSEAHLQGALHLHDLEKVDRLRSATLSPGQVARFGVGMPGAPDFASPPRSAVTFLAQLAKATANFQAHFAGPIAWDSVNYHLAPFVYGYSGEELAQFAQMIVYEFAYRAMAHGGDAPGSELRLDWIAPATIADQLAVTPHETDEPRRYRDYEHTAQQLAWRIFETLQQSEGLHVAAPALGITVDERFFKAPGADAFLEQATGAAAAGFPVRLRFVREAPRPLTGAPAWQPSEVVFGQVALNLPRLACLADSEAAFYEAADQIVALSCQGLAERRAFLESILARGAVGPLGLLAVQHGAAPLIDLEQTTGRIALHGLNEAVQLLGGAPLHASDDACQLGARIVERVAQKCALERRKRGFAIELGPGLDWNVSHRFANLDAQSHPEKTKTVINVREDDKRMHYTPGVGVAAGAEISPFDRVRVEGEQHQRLDADRWVALAAHPLAVAPGALADLARKAYYQTLAGGIYL